MILGLFFYLAPRTIKLMKKTLYLVLLFFIVFSTKATSQDIELSSSSIPVNLLEHANAIVRDITIEVFINDLDDMTLKKREVITILNKVGHEQYSDARAYYDNDTRIKKISARYYDAQGEEIKKYSKSKFIDVSAVSGGTLYDDSRMMLIDYTPVSYPYTIEFETESELGSTGIIPSWRPVLGYYLGVQKSTYRLINKTETKIRVKEKNFKGFNIQRKELDDGFEYVLQNSPGIEYENSSVGFSNLSPVLMVAASNFELKGVKGSGENWKDYGKWMYDKLLFGKTTLDELTQTKVRELVSGVEDPMEKAKILYKYMQNKTRYISVQVGIGGWEPIAANQVDKVGYGDCKGLTNYMKALLEVVGVESYYTVVYADDQVDIDEEFTSLQGNHVILNLPNNGNDVWLECTSQTMPFGFLGTFTDDRNVLVVTPEGGIIKRTPKYLNDDNLQKTQAVIKLDEQGNVKATVVRFSTGTQYDDSYDIENMSQEELEKFYKSSLWEYNNNLEITSVEISNNKEAVELTEELSVDMKSYASLNQGEYIFRVNVFNLNDYMPRRYRNRVLPLKVSRGYKDIDEYTIKIPNGYSITALPEDIDIEAKFGSYKMTLSRLDDQTMMYKKEILIKDGVYPKEDYNEYRKFWRKIARYENTKIALRKD